MSHSAHDNGKLLASGLNELPVTDIILSSKGQRLISVLRYGD